MWRFSRIPKYFAEHPFKVPSLIELPHTLQYVCCDRSLGNVDNLAELIKVLDLDQLAHEASCRGISPGSPHWQTAPVRRPWKIGFGDFITNEFVLNSISSRVALFPFSLLGRPDTCATLYV